MISKDVKRLLQKLNDPMTRALEGAAGLAVGRGHYEVTVEHLLTKLLEDGTGDAGLILTRLGVEPGRVGKALTDALERFKTGNAGRPAFSPLLLGLVERAWVAGSVHHGLADIRSGAFLEAFLESDAFATSPVREAMSVATADAVRERFFDLIEGSDENRASRRMAGRVPDARGGSEGETALDLYTHSMTDQAREGNIDAVFGRDREIRQVIDVLSRRRKNNPILVGEAGVGKTAVVEGLALRIVAGDVPESLREAEIAALDLGALQAGAGVKGEFEARMKAVIDAVKDAPRPTILFIDEAHTLVGAGGAAGTGDAANLLKPALARGELRSIAATTWSEYKRHIEKDPALARRFQMVKVDEPGIETAVVMMRGIRDRYEDHHHVQITDAAVRAAVELSDRYLSGRQLPDKAVDLLDTASARVKMSQDATPAALDDVGRRLHELETEITAVRRDLTAGLRADDAGLAELEAERDRLTEAHTALDARWREEQTAARALDTARQGAAGGGASDGIHDLHARLAALQTDGNPLVHAEVGERVVAEVIADWTGIPIGDMIKDEAQMLLELEQRLTERIRGQDEALQEIADALRTAKAGMRKKDAPIGVFLLAGPSGVGKTETARALAELLFGGERFLVSINMSEYQESHTTSQLKGAPPGYVGYGEGGVLTEAVRQRPYSVVLLDEVEKAHIDVMEMFYQVFDRGILRDGEGREVDFSNAVILCTSNVGSDLVQQASMAETAPSLDTLRTLIHEPLANHFQPALLGRMNVVPFLSLDRDAMGAIARLKLNKVDQRLREAHGIRFVFSDTVVERIADRCTTIDAGARNIDAIIDRTVLPAASRALLTRLAEERLPAALHLGIDDAGEFTYTFVDPGEAPPEGTLLPPTEAPADVEAPTANEAPADAEDSSDAGMLTEAPSDEVPADAHSDDVPSGDGATGIDAEPADDAAPSS